MTVLLDEMRDRFRVVLDVLPETTSYRDLTDDPFDDIREVERKINNGTYQWFMLRARVYCVGVELASNVIGGFLYENVNEVLTDGVAEEVIFHAIDVAIEKFGAIAKEYNDADAASV